VGVSLVHAQSDFDAAVKLAFSYDPEILVERYIRGMEVQVGILGERALGAIEIVPKDVFYSYKAKYEQGMSDHFFPARIPKDVYTRTLDADCSLTARWVPGIQPVDFIIDNDGVPYILEVNTLPGMTATSLLPEIAQGAGIRSRPGGADPETGDCSMISDCRLRIFQSAIRNSQSAMDL